MFFLTEVKYRLIRSPGRSIILTLVSVMLVCSMGAYMGNAQTTQRALDNLAESIPVTARVVSRDGSKISHLSITTHRYDALVSANVQDVLCTAEAAAKINGRQDTSSGRDVTVFGISHPDALTTVQKDDMRFLDGYDGTFLNSIEPLCALDEGFARANGLELGDKLNISFYSGTSSGSGRGYADIGVQQVKIAAYYPNTETNGERSPNMVVPISWLRAVTEQAGAEFSYSSLSVVLCDPMKLNSFKEALPSMAFYPVDHGCADMWTGNAVSMEDELFIKTAEELQANLLIYQRFEAMFFLLIVLMVMLVVFLVLRVSRTDMAIASSLGESRKRIGGVHFTSTILTQFGGGLVAQFALIFQIGLTLQETLQIFIVYLVCACAGTVLALLQLFRFDTLSLLTKSEGSNE